MFNIRDMLKGSMVGMLLFAASSSVYAGPAEDMAKAEVARLTSICNAAMEAAANGLTARGLIEVLYKANNLSADEKSLYITCYDKQMDSMLGRGK